MRNFYKNITKQVLFCVFALAGIGQAAAQRIYADNQTNGASGLVCVNCNVTNAANATDGNVQTFSVINVSVGLAAQTRQDLIFTGTKPTAGKPVAVKLGTGNDLLSLQALGAISLQAYNGSTAIGSPVAASSLVTVLSNNNQLEVNLTPAQNYDRVRITLNGGLAGALGSLYVYEAFFNGNGPVACNTAVDELHGISAGLLNLGAAVGGVVNPQNAIDGNLNTASTLNAGVGLAGAYAQQAVIFNNTSVTGDSVRLTLSVPQALLDAGVLGNTSVTTYNGNASNNDTRYLNSSLLNVRLLDQSGNQRKVTVTFAPAQVFDRVQLTLGGGIANVLTTLNLFEAERVLPSPVVKINNVAASSTQICTGNTVTLTAAAVPNTSFNWYTQATGGTPVATGEIFTTPALTTTVTYYAEAMRAGCTDASQRTPVTINVNQVPLPPVITNNALTICSGQTASFTVQPVNGLTYSWFAAPGGGTPLFTGNTFTTGALTATAYYYAEAENGTSCGSATRTQVTAIVTAVPANAAVAQTTQICSGSTAVLSATSSEPGITFNWYSTVTGGAPIFTGAHFTTPALTANTSYYVEAAGGNCVSAARAEADVMVNPLPAAPTVTITPAGGQVASGQTAQITASSATADVTFRWYTANSGGTAIFTGTTFTTPVLTSNTTYYVEAMANSTGCLSSSRTPVAITVNPVFSTSCDFATTQVADVNGGLACAGCNITNPNNAADADTTTFSHMVLPVAAGGSYIAQRLIFSDAGSAGDTVTIRLMLSSGFLNAGVAGQIQLASFNGTIYNNDRAALNSNTVRVQVLAGGQAIVVKFVPQGAYDRVEVRLNSGLLALLGSLDIYYASKQVAAPLLTSNTTNICSGSTATFTVANTAANVTYKWYTSPIGGTAVATGATFTSGLLNTTTTFYAESSRTANGCINPNRVAATANVTPLPLSPVLAANAIQSCSGNQVSLMVTNAAGATVNWYDASTGGNLLFTGANFQASPVASTTYYAELVNGSCISPARTAATVTINPRPGAPGVQSPSVMICAGGTATLQVLNPEAGITYNWYAAATGGTPVFAGTGYTTGPLNQNTPYYIEAVNTLTGCNNLGGRTQVSVLLYDQVSAPVLSAVNTTACTGGNVALSVTNPVNGFTYSWYTTPTGGTPVFNGTTYIINNLTANVSYYVEAANAGGCISATRSQTDINVLPVPATPQLQPASVTINGGQTATLNISNVQAGVTYNWYTTVNGGTPVFTGTSYTTPALTTTTTYYVEAQSGSCTGASRGQVTVTVNGSQPTPPDVMVTPPVQTVSSGQIATFMASSNTPGAIFNWYTAPTGGTPLFTGAAFTTTPVTGNTVYYVDATDPATGLATPNRATAMVILSGPAATPPDVTVTPPARTVNSGETAMFTASSTTPGAIFKWYTSATDGTPLFTGATFTTPAVTANTVYYAEAVDPVTGLSTPTRATATVTINGQGGSTPPDITVTPPVRTVNSGETTTFTASSTTPGAIFKWYTSATGGTPLFTGATFTTPAVTANIVYYAEAVDPVTGLSTPARATATVTINGQGGSTPPDITVTPPVRTVNSGETTTFTASSTTPGAIFKWYTTPTGGMPLFTGAIFTAPTVTGNVIYYAEATDPITGMASTTRATATVNVGTVPAADVNIFIPNAFSPNGDGNNDIFYVYGNDIKSMTYWVYDQWGGMLYRATSKAQGWDGTYKGKNQPVGVYVYYMEALMNDGQKITKKGTINLLR